MTVQRSGPGGLERLDEVQLEEAQSLIDDLLDQLGSHGLAGMMKSLWYRLDDKNRLK